MKHDTEPFDADLILPTQFAGTLRREAPGKKGEYQLLVAVLEDAIHCYQKHLRATRKSERQLFRDAEQWIMGRHEPRVSRAGDDRPGFSFEGICDLLDIDAGFLRRGLARWRDAQRTDADEGDFAA